MDWNWKQDGWPHFRYDPARIAAAESDFLRQGGILIGAFKHLAPSDESELIAETALSEAVTTSAIEGEILDRRSVRSSILRQLGLSGDTWNAGPREQGIAQLTVQLLRRGAEPLSHQVLFDWHAMLMQGRQDIPVIGAYRTGANAMRVVSGPSGRERVHFEAPPSERVPREMDVFIEWFNASRGTVPPLARSGIAHLHFETVHPFEDGNGRIGRAISEMALAQALETPCLTMLSTEIGSQVKAYYQSLELANTRLEITDWLVWFAQVVLAAQRRTISWIEFLIAKARLLDSLRGAINARQEKALLRMFLEGPSGFKGGLSAGNYQTITGASPATAGRDLAELVKLGALKRTGMGKGTRYRLDLGDSRSAMP